MRKIDGPILSSDSRLVRHKDNTLTLCKQPSYKGRFHALLYLDFCLLVVLLNPSMPLLAALE